MTWDGRFYLISWMLFAYLAMCEIGRTEGLDCPGRGCPAGGEHIELFAPSGERALCIGDASECTKDTGVRKNRANPPDDADSAKHPRTPPDSTGPNVPIAKPPGTF